MAITAADVSTLRAMTGAGMMDCKKALEEAEGDIEKGAEILRKKGIVKAAKRAGKVASEGIVSVAVNGNSAVVLEVNSETDFAAKNDEFKNIVTELTNHIIMQKPATAEEAMAQEMDGKGVTVESFITDSAAKIGEKITLRRSKVFEKSNNDVFGNYIHMGGKIGVLVLIEGSTDSELASDIAMHAAAAAPKYLYRDEVLTEEIDKEKEIYTAQLKEQGKPDNIIENILKGKMDKYYEEVCLSEQMFVKDDKKKITELLPEGASIKTFARFEVGEGIEKKECDFAAEVAEQLEK